MRQIFVRTLAALALVAAGCGAEHGSSVGTMEQAAKAAAKSTMSTPTIEFAGATQTTISIRFTAGATGAPAGFSLQWMTKADYDANGGQWYTSDDLRLCKASFSGNANLSRYTLKAGEVVTVDVGEFLFDNGASSNCIAALECGTDYVFRAFAHATSTLQRSDFTAALTASTLACDSAGACTYTQGFWKTHGPIPSGNNVDVWPVTELSLGTVVYTDLQLQAIFDTPASGNGLVALAHQLIAAKLNLASGADSAAIAASIDAADALVGALVVPPVGNGSLAPSATTALTGTLTGFNEGAIGPGHCQ